MTCGHCVRAVTQAVQALDPAASVKVDLGAKEVGVESRLLPEEVIHLASYRNVQGTQARLDCRAADSFGCLMNLRILLILGALSAFAPLAIDFYLPGFPAMAVAFGTDEKHIQLTLAVYFTGLAVGQLIYGPLADRFGRRAALLSSFRSIATDKQRAAARTRR
eukprot:gene15351-19597_t